MRTALFHLVFDSWDPAVTAQFYTLGDNSYFSESGYMYVCVCVWVLLACVMLWCGVCVCVLSRYCTAWMGGSNGTGVTTTGMGSQGRGSGSK